MIEGNKTPVRRRNSYVGRIKCDTRVKILKKLKERASNMQNRESEL